MSRQNLLVSIWQRKIIRFVCVGMLNTTIDASILNALVFIFGIKLLIANLMSASISIVISYFLNHAIVFQRHHKLSVKLFIKFVMITGLSIILVQSLVIYGFEHLFSIAGIHKLSGLSKARAHFIQVNGAKATAVLVGMVWNFVLYHLVVFRSPNTDQDITEEGIVPY